MTDTGLINRKEKKEGLFQESMQLGFSGMVIRVAILDPISLKFYNEIASFHDTCPLKEIPSADNRLQTIT